MVSRGWALADRSSSYEYLGAEQSAQSARAGIWSSDFVTPAQWRNGQRLSDPAKGGEGSATAQPTPAQNWGPMPLNAGP